VGILRIGIVVQVVVGLGLDRLELRADDHVSLAWGKVNEGKGTYDG
jgi:hypothetical protein